MSELQRRVRFVICAIIVFWGDDRSAHTDLLADLSTVKEITTVIIVSQEYIIL